MSERSLRTLIVSMGLVYLVVGCWVMFATESFGKAAASFDGFNVHDLRDFSTVFLALGLVLVLAAERPTWRLPVFVFAALENGLHALLHAVDVGESDPAWVGPAELVALLTATAAFAWLGWIAARRQRNAQPGVTPGRARARAATKESIR